MNPRFKTLMIDMYDKYTILFLRSYVWHDGRQCQLVYVDWICRLVFLDAFLLFIINKSSDFSHFRVITALLHSKRDEKQREKPKLV